MPATADTHDAQGRMTIYESFAYVLLNKPDEAVVDAARKLCHALLDESAADEFERFAAKGDDLEQAYFNRFCVPSTTVFAAAWEQAVRDAFVERGVVRMGGFSGAHTAQVVACYNEWGFDYSKLSGCEEIRSVLHADSLACELAFVAALYKQAFELGQSSPDDAERAYAAARVFVTQHLGRWAGKLAELMEPPADAYAVVVRALATWVEMDRGNE